MHLRFSLSSLSSAHVLSHCCPSVSFHHNLTYTFLIAAQLLNSVSSLPVIPPALLLSCALWPTFSPSSSSNVRHSTRSPSGSVTNLPVAEGALVAPATANPPSNEHQGIIFSGAWAFISSFLVFFLNGRQARRERDVAVARAEAAARANNEDMTMAV